ncbi:MAG: hypothetical protein ACUVQZ_05555 [Candidatus Caldatribacteriaceae bacterium]
MGYILVFDAGTSSLKVTIFNEHFVPLTREKVEYAYEADGLRIQVDAEKIWNAFVAVMRRFQDRGISKSWNLSLPVFSFPPLLL